MCEKRTFGVSVRDLVKKYVSHAHVPQPYEKQPHAHLAFSCV